MAKNKGNPNPSPETRFGGPRGNPIAGGKSSAQRKAEYRAAEISAELRLKALEKLLAAVDAGDVDPRSVIQPDHLRLFKDSEDRAGGMPSQPQDVTFKTILEK